MRVRCRHSSSLERLWLPGGVLHRWGSNALSYNNQCEVPRPRCQYVLYPPMHDWWSFLSASTLGYQEDDQWQHRAVDITIIEQPQGLRPSQEVINAKSFAGNKEEEICFIFRANFMMTS